MNVATECPPRELIHRLLTGQEDANATERFATHLENCPHCTAAIRELSTEEPLLVALRRDADQPGVEDNACLAELMANLCRLRLTDHETAVNVKKHGSETRPGGPIDATQLDDIAGEVAGVLESGGPGGALGTLGTFAVRQILGAGGMGIVLAAEDVQLGRPVAIKVMRQPLARMSTARERFLREAKAMAAVEDELVWRGARRDSFPREMKRARSTLGIVRVNSCPRTERSQAGSKTWPGHRMAYAWPPPVQPP
jgi:hypothetical protein